MTRARRCSFGPTNAARPLDFRFYLDLNRNGRFESNGPLPSLGPRGQCMGTNGRQSGSGEWRGAEQFLCGRSRVGGSATQPGCPHSPTNRFLGRMAYLVQPAGKSLDLNFIGNHALRLNDTGCNWTAIYRNQGVGSWELNLAALLRDLNTNVTRFYSYDRPGSRVPPTGAAAEDALSFLRYRYDGDLRNLLASQALYGPAGRNTFEADRIDGYSDGPAFTATNLLGLTVDDDLRPPNKPWAGATTRGRTWTCRSCSIRTRSSRPRDPSWPARMLLAQTGSPATTATRSTVS